VAEFAALLVLWLATWLLHSTLLYGIAWLIERLALLRAPAARQHLWRAAMLGALLTAGVQSAGLVQRVPLDTLFSAPVTATRPSTATAAAPTRLPDAVAASAGTGAHAGAPRVTAARAAARPAVPSATLHAALPETSLATPPAALPSSLPTTRSLPERLRAALAEHWAGALLALWAVGTGLAVLRLGALAWLARRELADRVPAEGLLADEFAALCDTQGVARPALSVAPALAGPISLPNGEIVVPPWTVTALDARQRRAMLAHELAHQLRRDPQWLSFALGLHALLWLQPLAGLARARLAALAELQADAWAARAVDDPRALAECLAECAERLTENRVALFGAAMTSNSLLVERVDRLLEGTCMRTQTTSWLLRGGVLATLVAAALLFPGCDAHSIHMGGFGESTSINISNDGEASVKVRRSGYSLQLETDGKVTFAADESDVATLAPGCEFKLKETLDGVKHEYTVKADGSGALTRSFDAATGPPTEADRQWLAAALPRMFRESGFDAEARVARLLASGGPAAVIAEANLAIGDHAKADYLGTLLGTAQLDAEQTGLALAAAATIDSDYELRRALTTALTTQSLDAPRFVLLLQSAQELGSDYDKAELLLEACQRLPADDAARTAWVAAAAGLGSDYDLGRTLQAGLARSADDGAFSAQIVACAAQHIGSDYSLGEVLSLVAPRGADPALAAAYLAATRKLGSDYECRTALLALLDQAKLDAAGLATALDVTAGLGSDFEKGEVLKALAGSVAKDADLDRRYREVASTMSDHERGAALLALDNASR